ncbi:putative malate dehydrogenase 1B isoform X2 [Esox lucius]|uniref:Lactate/malate dehydrogenase C-terminal domain-containing protein n=1 Tax=Esox lucius TaxID=8010 RepID=A0A3P8Z1J4_ESOLU|nr:putative malate dehydrogenase 1B isoform X2 [Esox lucius]
MAQFVLAGKANCPYFAKAEFLADLLQRSLPKFNIHKICMHPNEWQVNYLIKCSNLSKKLLPMLLCSHLIYLLSYSQQWLETTCKEHGWQHENSPMIWRELIHRGGKGMLLGGFNDFLEHVQAYYSISSDMTSELMMKIAAENLKTREICMEEEVYNQSLVKPKHIWISSALNPTCYSLIPQLFAPGVFQDTPTISLHLLDVGAVEEELQGIRMETQDLALPQLHEVTVHTELDQAFQQAHTIILLDDLWPEDGEAGEDEGENKVRKVSERYRQFGRLIEERAHKDVMVVVAGNSLVNLKCSLLLENTSSVSSGRFVAMATQLEYEARAHISQKLFVKTADVTDVIVWGNISGSYHIDLQRAKVFHYNGAIWGWSDFSQPVLEMIYDRKWLECDFMSLVSTHRHTVASKSQRATAISATNGIIAVLKAWNNNSSAEQVLSLGILSTGQYNLPAGVVFSMPVTFQHGRWSELSDVIIGDELRAKLQIAVDELREEKDLASRTRKGTS